MRNESSDEEPEFGRLQLFDLIQSDLFVGDIYAPIDRPVWDGTALGAQEVPPDGDDNPAELRQELERLRLFDLIQAVEEDDSNIIIPIGAFIASGTPGTTGPGSMAGMAENESDQGVHASSRDVARSFLLDEEDDASLTGASVNSEMLQTSALGGTGSDLIGRIKQPETTPDDNLNDDDDDGSYQQSLADQSQESNESHLDLKDNLKKPRNMLILVAIFHVPLLIVGIIAGIAAIKTEEKSRGDLISSHLGKRGIIDLVAIDTDGSSEQKALEWITKDDPMRLDPGDKYLPQRYALAALYYETNCGSWNKEDDWLSANGFCTWHGVTCVGDDEYFQKDGNADVFRLDMKGNGLKGALPRSLVALTALHELNFDDNKLNGFIPKEYKAFKTLQSLALDDNLLMGEIPSEIFKIRELHKLRLARNLLTGTIPNNIGKGTKLRGMSLEGNKLVGTLPHSMKYLRNLEMLYLNQNMFEGTLGYFFYSMNRLENVDLSENKLSGTLSKKLYKLSHLRHLHLTDNDFTGKIPDLHSLELLKGIHLEYNSFTGDIPTSVGELIFLENFSAEQNRLEGSIPYTACGLTFENLNHLSVDCAFVRCNCCTECHNF